MTRVCLEPSCCKHLLADPTKSRDRELVEETRFSVTVFTREFGAVPGYTTSQYCRSKLFLCVWKLFIYFWPIRVQHTVLS